MCASTHRVRRGVAGIPLGSESANQRTETVMKIVVVGGTGLIGSQVVALVRDRGHEAVAAAPSTGVDTLTGQGLAQALKGADVVVDVSNSPSFETEAALDFFTRSARHLIEAERDAGVR